MGAAFWGFVLTVKSLLMRARHGQGTDNGDLHFEFQRWKAKMIRRRREQRVG